MRIDHHAYRKATRVAGFGFLLQAAIGLTLLVFGQLSPDTVFRFAAFYVLGGLLVWLSLIVIFYQHTQERLEALEEDELAAARTGIGSVFDTASDHERVASRRLRLMHQWLMPAVSLLMAMYLGLGAFWMLRHLAGLVEIGTADEFLMTGQLGWAVAVCLGFAAVCFIFSRFVAGMARQTAWQNLRGGAGYMVGNALVMLAAAVGIVFRYFDKDQVIHWIAYAIPFFMLALVLEIGIHFVLNIYRPRIPGDVPRPAFDSRVLSLLAAPESIVRSVNEAVNYQFGFDITSSWGYQLLLRSFGWLAAFGVIVLVVLNMMVIVEPYQQAVKIGGGRIIGGVHGAGIMWKLPWPLQSSMVYDVGRVRVLPLTAQRLENPDVQLWSKDIRTDANLDPFIVGGMAAGAGGDDLFSLVNAEMSMEYRIKPDALMDYLNFSSDERRRGTRLSMRQSALKAIAMQVATRQFSTMSIEDAIARGREDLVNALRDRMQVAYDDPSVRAGIEVVSVSIPRLRPGGDVAKYYEDLAIAMQERRETVAKAEQAVAGSLAYFIGDPERIGRIIEAIDTWQRLRHDLGSDDRQVIDQRIAVERLLADSGGALVQEIDQAEADRWIELMRARSEVYEYQGLLASYRAAPELFMERQVMKALAGQLSGKRKYVIVGIDPNRLHLGVELSESPSLFSFEGGSSEGASEK